MPREDIVVIADRDTIRRRRAVELIATKAEPRECEDFAGLSRAVMDTAPCVVVLGSIGNDPYEIVEAANAVRELRASAKVIVVADFSSEAIAIDALRAGVFEYLKAPVDSLEIAEAVSRAIPFQQDNGDGFDALIGNSEPMQKIKGLIRRIAPLSGTVLITGESGTGKEIVAQLIHQHSTRQRSTFVCVNCAAIPDTLVESELFGHERGAFTGAVTRQMGQMKKADGGTLFLDEVGDLSSFAQSKMLRALEQREIQPLGGSRPIPVDIRLVTATHRDLESLIAEDRFRRDLYYRLDVSRIHVPPLRERKNDIAVLAVHFIRMMNRAYGRNLVGLTPAALQTLARHDWPGNVRQLRNVIEAAAIICSSDRISDHDLRSLHSFTASSPPPLKTAAAVGVSTTQFKPGKDELLEVLQSTQWNMTKTAELLKWSRSTLYRNVARYKIDRREELTLQDRSDAPGLTLHAGC